MRPASARSWLRWSAAVLDSFARPSSAKLEYDGYTDRRMNSAREEALSVFGLLQKSGNGNGSARLVADYILQEMSWYGLTPQEQRAVGICLRRFAAALRREGFIEGKG